MFRPTMAFTMLALGALGMQQQGTRRPAQLPDAQPPGRGGAFLLVRDESPPGYLQEERMIIEYSAATDEAAVIVEAESEEALASVVVLGPNDVSVLELRSSRDGLDLAISGFVVERREMSTEVLFETYREGTYTMQAMSADGRSARGSAVLSHDLLPAPTLLYPPNGTSNVPTDLIVGWISDPQALGGYQVVLEQDENDGLTARLPAGTSSFQVPEGVLSPGKESHVEVGAIGSNGNITLVESFFTTR